MRDHRCACVRGSPRGLYVCSSCVMCLRSSLCLPPKRLRQRLPRLRVKLICLTWTPSSYSTLYCAKYGGWKNFQTVVAYLRLSVEHGLTRIFDSSKPQKRTVRGAVHRWDFSCVSFLPCLSSSPSSQGVLKAYTPGSTTRRSCTECQKPQRALCFTRPAVA